MKNYETVFLAAIAALLIVALICSPIACTMHRQRLIADAIKNGADPIAAKCAIEGGDGDSRTSSLCMAKALEKH